MPCPPKSGYPSTWESRTVSKYKELEKMYHHCLDRFIEIYRDMSAEIKEKDAEIARLKRELSSNFNWGAGR